MNVYKANGSSNLFVVDIPNSDSGKDENVHFIEVTFMLEKKIPQHRNEYIPIRQVELSFFEII